MKTIGRRKCSIATVEILNNWNQEEKSKFLINKKTKEDYFQNQIFLLQIIKAPFVTTTHQNKYHVNINVNGGGLVSQAYAIRLAISKILIDGNFFYALYKKNKEKIEEKNHYRFELYPSRYKLLDTMYFLVCAAHLTQFFEKLKLKTALNKQNFQAKFTKKLALPKLTRLTEKKRTHLEERIYYFFSNAKARKKITDYIEQKKTDFKLNNYLTRDPRVKERRKYGRKKARKRSQFSKR